MSLAAQTNSETLSDQTTTLVLTDFSDASKAKFYEFFRNHTIVIPPEDLDLFDTSGVFSIAWVNYDIETKNGRIFIKDPQLFINQAVFQLDGKDNTSLICITQEHEIAEAWSDISQYGLRSRRHKDRSARDFGHNQALLAEFRLAHELGVARTYLDLIARWTLRQDDPQEAEIFWLENEQAFKITAGDNGEELLTLLD